jgi:hypothetical protein
MCKVLIKKIEKVHAMKTGGPKDKTWKLFLFDCLVEVDGSGVDGVRTVKTFDEATAKQIEEGTGKTFESKKQGDAAPFSYLVGPEKKQGSGFRAQASGETNRQTALKCAVQTVKTGGYVQTLEVAEKYLAWLDGGVK